jgi:hypothetical protein
MGPITRRRLPLLTLPPLLPRHGPHLPRPGRRCGAPIALCMAAAASLHLPAETITWTPGMSIDCPLAPSLPSRSQARTIVFPLDGGALTQIPTRWGEDELAAKAVGNTLILDLRDPSFQATLQVFDEKGLLFLLDVHAAPAGSAPDDCLTILQAAPTAPMHLPADSDGAITAFMAGMVAGGCQAGMTSRPVTHIEHGTIVPGRVILDTPRLRIALERIYQAGDLRGFLCFATAADGGEIDMQRLWFPGALAVYASDKDVLSCTHPGVRLPHPGTISLYYVAE